MFLCCSIILVSCKKESSSEHLKIGTYKGSFIVSYNGEKHTSDNVEVIFDNENKYTSTGKRNPRIPAGGSGTYIIKNKTIQFSDKNPWTAEFDWGLILSGEYQYVQSGNHLTLKKIIKSDNITSIYQYDLIRQ